MSPSIPKTFQIEPIGFVRQTDAGAILQIDPAFGPALKDLGEFGYVIVLWWADQMDTPEQRRLLQTDLPYAPGKHVGVFACRSPYRPNPIAVTTAFILNVDEAACQVTLAWIDAHDGTPILDLKPYIPMSDRPRDVRVASWLEDWPSYMEDAAEYFATHTVNFGS